MGASVKGKAVADYVEKNIAGSGKDAKIDQLRRAYAPKAFDKGGSSFSSVGELIERWDDKVKSDQPSEESYAKRFDGKESAQTPVIVVKKDGELQAVGKQSKTLAASASASTQDVKVLTYEIENDPKQIAIAEKLQIPDLSGPMFGQSLLRFEKLKMSEAGELLEIRASNIEFVSGKKHEGTEAQVLSAAKDLLQSQKLNNVPLMVEKVGESYRVLGNHFVGDVVQRADLDKVLAIVVRVSRQK